MVSLSGLALDDRIAIIGFIFVCRSCIACHFFTKSRIPGEKVGDFEVQSSDSRGCPGGTAAPTKGKQFREDLLGGTIPFFSEAKEDQDADQRERHEDAEGPLESRRSLVPSFAKEIAEGDECGRPEQALLNRQRRRR